MDKKDIVLNRMYVGDYLDSNLGHEVINLFCSDNGGHYVYLNAMGTVQKKYDNIGTMLFVKYYDKDIFEVVGKAEGLQVIPGADEQLKKDITETIPPILNEQKRYIEEHDITYGGVSLLDIFNKAEQQSVFITYKADKVSKVAGGKRVLIGYGKSSADKMPEGSHFVVLSGYSQPKTSLRSYIWADPSNRDKENIPEKLADYEKICSSLVNVADLWNTEAVGKVDLNEFHLHEVSLFDICKIQNDENRISCALQYFMSQRSNIRLWQNFFNRCDILLSDSFQVRREVHAKIEDKNWDHGELPGGGRIDLLIEDDKNKILVIIENKIKSGINTVAEDLPGKTQLNRYVNYITWLINRDGEDNRFKGYKAHFLIIEPNYNNPDLSEEMAKIYRQLTYSTLYEFLKENKDTVCRDRNFKSFYDTIYRHTLSNANDYLYYEMMEKFARRIIELQKLPAEKVNLYGNKEKETVQHTENNYDNVNINHNNYKMAIKSAISGEYIITQEDNGSIRVCQIFDNVKGSLREAAKAAGFNYDPNWTTRQFGEKLIKAYGDGQTAEVGEYTIIKRDSGSIESYRVHGNTIAVLRKIAAENEFKTEPTWNTRTLGSKLIDYVNGDFDSEEEIEETMFAVAPEMTVKELQDTFREMFGGHLRIKNGNKRCDEYYDSSTGQHKEVLDAQLSEIGCKAEGKYSVDMKVGDFQEKVKSDCGLSLVVATSDDWVAVLPEFTLDGVNLIPKNTTKAKMQEMLDR